MSMYLILLGFVEILCLTIWVASFNHFFSTFFFLFFSVFATSLVPFYLSFTRVKG